jgi:hypothetical protein
MTAFGAAAGPGSSKMVACGPLAGVALPTDAVDVIDLFKKK